MGVSGDVLAGYFTFYAVNGFYQHSNCLVWLGRLNYVISGPELHRWHHSMLALVYFARNNVTRFHVHFTPTRASWLNRVAGFFRNLSQQ